MWACLVVYMYISVSKIEIKMFMHPPTRSHCTHLRGLTAMMLKKSSSPSVSKIEETVCLAMVSLRPFMLPLTSTKITTSFGEVAAWMYHLRFRQSKAMTPCSSGFHLIPWRPSQVKDKQWSELELYNLHKKKTNCYLGTKWKSTQEICFAARKAACQNTPSNPHLSLMLVFFPPTFSFI